MKASTKSSYIQRIDRVVGYLNEKIEATPSLRDLADIAAISPYHFHRVYRAITGETPSGTVRRLRLARAAAMLKDTSKPVSEIAFDVGFETSQSFAKAFHGATGFSASDLRDDPEKLAATLKTLSNPPASPGSDKELDVKLVSTDPFRVIAQRHVGPHDKLYTAYRSLYDWAEKAGALENFKGIYGVPLDDPRSTQSEECRFDCAFDLGSEVQPGEGLKELILEGGAYAVIRHLGHYDGLDEKYDYLYGVWLPASGFALRKAPVFNHYLNDPDSAPSEEWETDIYLPVEEGEQP